MQLVLCQTTFEFPRSIDRGLIEAPRATRGIPRFSHFPGLLIGASLKPECLVGPGPGFPDFPGLLIGASLKLNDRDQIIVVAIISPVY